MVESNCEVLEIRTTEVQDEFDEEYRRSSENNQDSPFPPKKNSERTVRREN